MVTKSGEMTNVATKLGSMAIETLVVVSRNATEVKGGNAGQPLVDRAGVSTNNTFVVLSDDEDNLSTEESSALQKVPSEFPSFHLANIKELELCKCHVGLFR